MKAIIITRGTCGVKYTCANGSTRYTTKTAADGAFEIDDAQAERFVSLGVAKYATATEGTAQDPETTPETTADDEEGEQLTGHLDADQLGAMTYNELKKLAADMGVKPEGTRKDDYIAAICAADVEVGDEDELPELNAADPE